MSTYTALNLAISTSEKCKMLNEILSTPQTMWHWDEFRGCSMLPLYNRAGLQHSYHTGPKTLEWTPAGQQCQTIQSVVEQHISPWMQPLGRIVVLRTAASVGLNVHYDVNLPEIGTPQQKFRLVLKGEIDKLYFLKTDETKWYVPDNWDTYLLDGGHPHALDAGAQEKITICIGAPWRGQPSDELNRLIASSPFKQTLIPPQPKREWLDQDFKENR